MGLANRLTEPGGALDAARALAHELAALPPRLHARGPAVVIRAMGRAARRGDAHRAAARAGDAGVGRIARRRDPIRGGRRSPRRAAPPNDSPSAAVVESGHARHAHSGTGRAHRRRRHVASGRHRAARRDRRRRRRNACAIAASDRWSSIDHDDRAIGILTERDMIRLAAAGSDASTAKVSEWMTGDPDTIGPDVEARAAFTPLAEHGYRHIPVVETRHRQKLVGIVSMRDLMRVAMIQPAAAQAHDIPKGLEGVVVADTTVGDVRGLEGFYHYRQYSAVDLAKTPPARRRLVPAVQGPAARRPLAERDAFAADIRAPPRDPRRGRRRCCPRSRAPARRSCRSTRCAPRSRSTARRSASARRSTSTTRRCATTRCRRARSCPR